MSVFKEFRFRVTFSERGELILGFPGGFPGISNGNEFTYSAGDPGSIPGSGRAPEEGIGYPLQWLPPLHGLPWWFRQ